MPRQDLSELVAISRLFGSDPEYVLGGGGNTSFKTATRLFVKSSGASLAEIDAEGFVCLDRQRLRNIWERRYAEDPHDREAEVLEGLLAAREKGEEAKRPSVEALLHEAFDAAYVVHTHPSLVNGLACSVRGKETARELFADRALWIPAVNPGFQLADAVRREMEAYRKRLGRSPDILILQNHGLCVAGSGLEDLRNKSASIMEAIRQRVGSAPTPGPAAFDRERAAALAPALRALLMGTSASSILTFRPGALPEDPAPRSLAFTPDHIVYCNHEPMTVPESEQLEDQYRILEKELADYRTRNGFPPKIIIIERLGAFAWGPNRKSADTAMAVFLDVMNVIRYSRAFGGPRPMSPDQIDFIIKWEAEAHRKKVSAGPLQAGRMAERIALVTGAAQGFGLGISEALLREGANVVLADLNVSRVKERAAELGKAFGAFRAEAVGADVTEEASVRDMVLQTVLSYGGLDLFVSNAGVLRAGSLEEIDLAAFEFVNRVNYTAYFLGVRHASRPMKIQHRFAPHLFMDIIQINSKTGLEGSNRNFSYAGSKFAGIGLTQSFALELIEHNIKVNAVCPGNLFDGPLWSDPDKGLFVQYLKTGKVPGARTIAEVRRFYEEKVPMKRGCTVEDVARAILYLVEQVYETGQALPVTGGQVMLR